MKKILLVDDSVEVRTTLAKLLGTIRGIQIVGQASDSLTFIEQFEKSRPNIVILDINLPVGNGIEILSMIKNISPITVVIMFTNYSNDAFKESTAKLGADYFLDKSTDVDKLLEILTNLSQQN